ncbi:ABC transporter ATP-binding protein [Streptococcus plurextorum]|uniref:ABC transporter ATP-binding protein n=1 Tax=Streptococcus plurextorum TaxID=456876 RepID=UPI0004236E84|nr:ABC transporter ATP-binding protein [Streptococcus plurextorum]
MRKAVISVKGLSKSIKKKDILHDISFEVHAGDCLALIGPNGAGKTTLMNCLLGDLKASAGLITVLDKKPDASLLKEKVAVLFQDNLTETGLRVQELLDFQKAIYKNPLSDKAIDAILRFSKEQKEQFAEKLSGGQRRLLAFVQLLIGQPDILILDEPTSGMDTTTRKRFWEIIADLKLAGKTIIYSSHYIEEVEHTADRILVLHRGKLLRDTTPYAMRREDREKCFTLPKLFSTAIDRSQVYDYEEGLDRVSFATREAELVWQDLQAAGLSIDEVEVTNRTLLNSIFAEAGEE